MKNQKGYTIVELLIAIFILFVTIPSGVGYIKNVVKLTQCDFEAPYKAEVVHTIGLIPPIGSITGWMDLGK